MRLPLLLAAIVAVPAAIAPLAVAQAQYPRPQPSQPTPAPPPAPAAAPARAAAPAPAAAAAPVAAAASTGAPTYPPPTCTAPDYPGKAGTDEQVKAFNSNLKAYDECVRKYADEAKAASDAAIEAGNKAVAEAKATSNAAIQAGNKLVVEYNKYMEEMRKQIAADKAAK